MDEIRALARDCREAATIYDDSPGLVGPRAVIDLYGAIARLCDLIEQTDKR